jgi:hypothetical protein
MPCEMSSLKPGLLNELLHLAHQSLPAVLSDIVKGRMC